MYIEKDKTMKNKLTETQQLNTSGVHDNSILSKENKLLLIDYIKKKLTIDTICSRDNISNPTYIFRYKLYHPLFIKHMKEWVDSNYVYDINELNEALTSEKPYETKFFKMVDNREKRLIAHVYCIKKLFDELSEDEFNFTYNQTNFKPCHNILIKLNFKLKGDKNFNRSTNIQIRKDGFPFNEGNCYGRNADVVKTYKLIDSNFDKYCKVIGIK